jgi:hypothetical protein
MKRGALLLIGILAPAAAARAELTARLSGRVDSPGRGDASVQIVCHGEVEVLRTASLSSDGAFAFDGLPPGRCRVQARVEGNDPAAALEVELTAGEERTIVLSAGDERRPWVGRGQSGSPPLAAVLPLPARTIEALLQTATAIEGDRGPGGSIVAGPTHGNRFQLDGFDITSPLTGGPGLTVPLAGVSSVELASIGQGVEGAENDGVAVRATTVSGSNRPELALMTSHLRLASDPAASRTDAALRASGPLVKDRLWFALAGEGLSGTGPGAGSGSAKVTWQATPRQRLILLAAGGARAQRDGIVGLRWEGLLTATLVAELFGAVSGHGSAEGEWARGWQGGGRLTAFGQLGGEHITSLGVREELMRGGSGMASAAGTRSLLYLEDAWRPLRHVTVTAGLAHVLGHFQTFDGGDGWRARGLAPQLALAWDATHDGRTVVRASAGTTVDAGSFGQARAVPAGSAPATGGRELAAGVAREVQAEVAASADLVQRWRGDLPPAAGPYRGLILALRKRSGRRRVSASYIRQTTRGARDAFTLAASETISSGFGAGVVAGYAPPGVWAALADPPAPGRAAGRPLTVAVNLHLGLAWLVGEPVVAWVDALDLVGAPAVRLGLAWAY